MHNRTRVALLVLLTLMIASAVGAVAHASTRLENPNYGFKGVKADAVTLAIPDLNPSQSYQYEYVKLVNQYGSNRRLMLGIRRRYAVGLDVECRLTYSDAPTQIYYYSVYNPQNFKDYNIKIAQTTGDPNRYNIYLDGSPIEYNLYWYTSSGTTAGTQISTTPYNEWAEGGKFKNIYVMNSARTWLIQSQANYSNCYLMNDNPTTSGQIQIPFYEWRADRTI